MRKAKLDEDEALKQVVSSFDELDEQRVAELQELNDTQRLREMMMSKEASRLRAKYGEDHPRVMQYEQRLAAQPGILQGIGGQISLASMPSSPLPLDGWRVAGRVFDAKGSGVAGITVYLADEKQQWIRQLGSSCSDDKGLYSLSLEAEALKKLGDRTIYLAASDKAQKEVYFNSRGYQLKKGVEEFQDIHLGGEFCVEPPKEPRNPDRPDTGAVGKPKDPAKDPATGATEAKEKQKPDQESSTREQTAGKTKAAKSKSASSKASKKKDEKE